MNLSEKLAEMNCFEQETIDTIVQDFKSYNAGYISLTELVLKLFNYQIIVSCINSNKATLCFTDLNKYDIFSKKNWFDFELNNIS